MSRCAASAAALNFGEHGAAVPCRCRESRARWPDGERLDRECGCAAEIDEAI